MPSFKSTSLLLAGLWLSQASASVQAATPYRDAFIVETDPSHGPLQDDFLDRVSKTVSRLGPGCKATPRKQFNSVHFTGASFDLECDAKVEQAAALKAIQSLGAVGKTWPVGRIQHQASIPKRGSPMMPIDRGLGAVDSHRNDALIPRDANTSDTLSTHVMGNVDRLHDAGFTGAGIRIAVVDSGFDTTVHGLSETKVTYTHDLTNNSTNVKDNCSFHGTHVLGIIGAKSADNLYGVSGVARDATFELYRIQSCDNPGASTDDLVAAFTEAADRGVDIITCSYGGTGSFPEEPWALAASRIAENGTFVSISAGNAGPGPFTGNTPATSTYLTAVGSADNSLAPCIQWQGSLTMGGKTVDLSVTPGGNMSFPESKLTVWSPAKMETNEKPENCSVVQTEPPKDLENTIVLIQLGQCWVDSAGVPLLASTQYNLTYALYYSGKAPDGQPEVCPSFRSPQELMYGVVQTNYATGSSVQAELAKGGRVEVTVPNNIANARFSLSNPKSPTSGLVSFFSSWGPSFDGRSMPSFVTPGQNILSTYPERLGSWAVIGGTSMATPYAAGVAALLKQSDPSLTWAQIQTNMAVTAHPIRQNTRQLTQYAGETEDFFAPVLQQGGGLVDAWAAAQTKTHVNVTNLSFNDTSHRPAKISFKISNMADEELIYDMDQVGAASGYFLNTTGGAQYNLTGNMGTPVFARLHFDPTRVTVSPGLDAIVDVSVAAEPDLPEGGVAYFGGYVSINISSRHTVPAADPLTIPYTGFKGDLASLPMVNRDQTYGGALNATSGLVERTAPGRVFTCAYNDTASTPCDFVPDGLVPATRLWLVTQSRDLTLDLVDRRSGAVVLPGEAQINSTTGGWNPGDGIAWNATDGNRTFVPPGDYLWRVTALRLNADSGTDKDWDVWESDYWTLQYAANSTGLPSHKRQVARPPPALSLRRYDDNVFHL